MTIGPKFTTEDCLNREHNPHNPEEFPRLERIALESFGIPFAELSPRFQWAVRQKAEQEAAKDMLVALNKCDTAFVAWQVGQIPGRPEDILALITEVRAAIAKAEGRL